MSERFYTELSKCRKNSKNTVYLSNEKYQQILHELLLLKDVDNLENEEQLLLEIFEKNELQYDDPILPKKSNYCENNQDNSIQVTIPTIQSNNANAIDNRRKAKENLENQAVKMKTWSDKKLKPAEVGAKLRVLVPDVDKGCGDARNILAVVMKVTVDRYYRLGTKEGLLKFLYSKSQFTICQKNLITIDQVSRENTLALRTITTQQSTGTG
ncbi:hypothetical protein QTP88_000609 [Uroleucon formosanum]